jgi:Flp pilus assembly protein TadG
MKLESRKFARGFRRSGAMLIYALLTMTILFAFLGLAVDIARAQTAKTELRRIADAAARAAVANLSGGATAAQNAAIDIAAMNSVDGAAVTLTASTDILIGNWNSSTHTFTSGGTPKNAVKVIARRTTANGNPIPLLLSGLVGVSTVDVWASSIAALVTVNSSTQYVAATSNIWLAGESAGTQASEPDIEYPNSDHKWKYDLAGTYGGTDPTKLYSTDYSANQPYESPAQVSFAVNSGDTTTVSVPTNSSNEASKGPGDDEGYANGTDVTAGGTVGIDQDESADGISEHGMSDISTPGDSLVAVFLSNSIPDGGTVPNPLDFTTQAERDYSSISPELQQSFYAGTGTTSSGSQQSISVPSGATRMFLGTMDGHEWSNNSGGYNVTITDEVIETVQ